MYKLVIAGKERSIDAPNVAIDKGTLIFYGIGKSKAIQIIVPAGKWDLLEIQPSSVQPIMHPQEKNDGWESVGI